MQRTPSWILSLALALALQVAPSVSWACDLCGYPGTVCCLHQDLLDTFHTGGGEAGASEGEDAGSIGGEDALAAYVFGGSQQGWTSTSGGTAPYGESAILTWSLVPDGTAMPQGQGEPAAPSDLIAFLDGIHHGGASPGGADLTQRAWFTLVKSAFDRWDAVSAIRFSYESNDDGVRLASFSGVNGVRGDHRIGGHNIDGDVRPSVVAYNYFPNNADMVIDTSEAVLMGNPGGNYLRFRNMLMHEIGHGLGLNHPASSDSNFLMEGLLDVTIDGPQFDDILGIHRLYGDRFEELGGNDSRFTATDMGSLAVGDSFQIGEDAVDRRVEPTDIDFVSINMSTDLDYFKISTTVAGKLSVLLTPLGPTYQSGAHGGTQTAFDASAQSDLLLLLYDNTGINVLASANLNGLGGFEQLADFAVSASDYFIRVSGLQDAAQFYQLNVALVPEPAGVALLALALLAFSGQRRR